MVSFGFSVGASWVGWAVVQGKEEILEAGVNVFEPFGREKRRGRDAFRQAKRLNRRRQTRVRDFDRLWLSCGFPVPEASVSEILQLRNRGLEEKLELAQLYAVLKSYLLHRGFFYPIPENPGELADKALARNIEELKGGGYPCKLQLERLEQYGSYRGDMEGETLSNTFPAGAYQAEARALLARQGEFYSCINPGFIEKYFAILERKRQFYGEEDGSWKGKESLSNQERLEGEHAARMATRILKALIRKYSIPGEIVLGQSFPSNGGGKKENRDVGMEENGESGMQKSGNSGIKKSGSGGMQESGDGSMQKSGNGDMRENGKSSMRKSGNSGMKKSENSSMQENWDGEQAGEFLNAVWQVISQRGEENGIPGSVFRMGEGASGRREELNLREEKEAACYSDYALEAMVLCLSDGIGRERLREKLLAAEGQVKYWHQVDRKANRTLCNQTIRGTRQLEGKVMKVNKLSLYTPEGYRTFERLLAAGKQELFLMYRHDRKSWDNLVKIYQDYRENKNAFAAYRKDTGEPVRKYAKNGGGAPVKQLKYLDGELGSCVDISHKYGFSRGDRRVVLENVRPYRTDVYFNRGTGRYHLVGVKYSDLKYSRDGYVIDGEAYHQALVHERVLEESSQMVLMGMETEYLFSLYKNDLIEYEKDGKRYVERFLSRTQPGKMNYIETKPVERASFGGRRHQVGLAKATSIRKIRTDILGNRYYCGAVGNGPVCGGMPGGGQEKFSRKVDLY